MLPDLRTIWPLSAIADPTIARREPSAVAALSGAKGLDAVIVTGWYTFATCAVHVWFAPPVLLMRADCSCSGAATTSEPVSAATMSVAALSCTSL